MPIYAHCTPILPQQPFVDQQSKDKAGKSACRSNPLNPVIDLLLSFPFHTTFPPCHHLNTLATPSFLHLFRFESISSKKKALRGENSTTEAISPAAPNSWKNFPCFDGEVSPSLYLFVLLKFPMLWRTACTWNHFPCKQQITFLPTTSNSWKNFPCFDHFPYRL